MGTHGSDDQFDIPMGEAPNRDRRRTSASTPRRPCPGLTEPSRPRSQSPPLSRPKPKLHTRPEGEPAAAPVASVTCRRGELRHHAGAEPPDRERGQEAHRPLNAETPKPGRGHAGDLNRLTLRTATSSRSPERRAANGRPGPGRARRRDPDPVTGPAKARQQRLTRIMREGTVEGETQEPPCGTNVVLTTF